jgi:hypothetical protein
MRLVPAVPIRLAAVAVLTAAGVAAAPGRADAGCGDYVTVAADTPDHRADAPDGSNPLAPCRSPGCSSRPTPPDVPLTAPTTAPTGPDQWADALGRTGDHAPHPAAGRTPPADPGRPVHFPRPIFHPPRPA